MSDMISVPHHRSKVIDMALGTIIKYFIAWGVVSYLLAGIVFILFQNNDRCLGIGLILSFIWPVLLMPIIELIKALINKLHQEGSSG